MKKTLSAILCAAMILSLTACDKQAKTTGTSKIDGDSSIQNNVFSDTDFEYEDIEGGIRITKYLGNGGDIVIPEEINGKSVIEISAYALDEFTGSVTSVSVPKSATSVSGFYPSADCDLSNFTSINVAKNNPKYRSVDGVLYEIDDDGELKLLLCPQGKSGKITLPDNVTSRNPWCFEDCTKLTDINVAKGNIKFCSLDGMLCEKMSDGGIKLLECPGGREGEITIPAAVTEVNNNAFYHCQNLTSIAVAKNNQNYFSIDGILCEKADNGVVSLVKCPIGRSGEVVIPDSVTVINSYAFSWCEKLNAISIPDSVNQIEWSAFHGCSSLISVNIPKDISEIDQSVFEDCSNLKAISIPDGVTKICHDAFRGCSSLVSINIPDSVTDIGDNFGRGTFADCTSLKNIAIPSSVSFIDKRSFNGCTNLSAINVAEDNPRYSSFDGALYDKKDGNLSLLICPQGKSGELLIDDNVTKIDGSIFADCKLLNKITVVKGDNRYCDYYSSDGMLYEKLGGVETVYLIKCPPAVSGKVEIPENVHSVSYYAFNGCSNVTSISVAQDNPWLFSSDGMLYKKYDKGEVTLVKCPEGKSGDVVIQNGTKEMDGAFDDCVYVTSIIIPNGITDIGVFTNCTSLSSITIPDSVSEIDTRAFDDCSDITVIYKGRIYDKKSLNDLVNSDKTGEENSNSAGSNGAAVNSGSIGQNIF